MGNANHPKRLMAAGTPATTDKGSFSLRDVQSAGVAPGPLTFKTEFGDHFEDLPAKIRGL